MRIKSLLLAVLIFGLFTQNSWAQCTDCTTLEFGKKVQLPLLSPLLPMDSKAKLEYIASLGVDLFKMPSPDESPTIAFLASPPVEIMKRYEKYFRDEGVLGLFLSHNATYNRVHTSTILLIESSDAWTITHEFMHYLFDRARLLEDPTSESRIVNNMSDAREDFFGTWERYKMFDGYANEEHKQATVANFIAYSDRLQQLLLGFEMEEMAIEKFLRVIYIHHKPPGFDQNSFDRSTRYIKSTGTKALMNLDIILEICSDVRKTLNASDKTLTSSLAQSCNRALSYKNAILKIGKDLEIEFENGK
ncbi:hypothetical protein QJS83_09145 [Bdellovibrio sp. 22V]|uniref:hypothetical protein n=1 Tax=Bdellovibrio TaxID=958 RepID=UPI0025435149|nr:hypothetical protein [Bdellovibrio sp. 22V]WII70622.1 hypothetical protein QJS83_09145 [Bdellovibrio sp. 22V]